MRLSCNWTDSLKAAHVSYNTVKLHERNDPEFAAQIREAEDEGIQLLDGVCFKEALEGHLEPIYHQGQIVGYIRKYDNRLRIEMLRAYRPNTFKTPGAKVAINTGSITNNTMIVDDTKRAELIELRRESLAEITAAKGLPAPSQPCEPTSQS